MSDDTDLVERIDDVDEFLRHKGRYHTTTAHQAYLVLKTLDWHPHVKLGEELFFPEGSVLFAEVDPHTMTPNIEKSGWGTTDDFYEKRVADYGDWEVAFWREVIQNSRDSGATRVDLECVPGVYRDPDTGDSVECMRVSVDDNGKGMDYDTLMSAFFRRGGTLKSEGSVGGFGDAKNLILTPWLGYEVRTQNVLVKGQHEDIYTGLTRKDLEYKNGTKVTAWMPLTMTTTPEYAQLLIEQSSLSQIRFTINGSVVKGNIPKGTLVDEKPITITSGPRAGTVVGDLILYHSARSRRSGVYVRSHGLFMYKTDGFQFNFKGVVTIEINAPPVGVFTTKRNSLSGHSTAYVDVNNILDRLGTDPGQLLKAKRDKKEIIIRGTGTIESREGEVSEMSARIASHAKIKKANNGTVTISKADVVDLVNRFTESIAEIEDDPASGDVGLAPLPSTFGTMMAQSKFVDVSQVAGAIQVSMWKPDFYLYQNISPWKMPKALHPETMSNKYHVLIRTWTELLKFLMVQFGMFETFGVGWVFDTEYDPSHGESVVAALYRRYEGEHWLLLNPVEITRRGYDLNTTYDLVGDRFKLSDQSSIENLTLLAVHELTHMQGFSRADQSDKKHNDAYSTALTYNMSSVFRIAPVLKKIVKEARSAVREVRKETERHATKVTWSSGPGHWVGKYRRRHVAEIYQWGPHEDEYKVTVYDRDGYPGSLPKEASLQAAKEAVDSAVLAQYPSRSGRYKWEWLYADKYFAIRKSDGLCYGYIEQDTATLSLFDAYLTLTPGDDTDVLYDKIHIGRETKAKAMGLVEELADEKFPTPSKKILSFPEPSIAWDEDQSGDYLYGYDPVSQATRVSVHTVPLRDGTDRDFYPRAWNDDSERWEEGRPEISMTSAKNAAEKMYAKLAAAAS